MFCTVFPPRHSAKQRCKKCRYEIEFVRHSICLYFIYIVRVNAYIKTVVRFLSKITGYYSMLDLRSNNYTV